MRTSDRESAAAERGSSKALSGRVSTSAGLDPHPITKYVWRTSTYASVITLVLALGYLGMGGDKRAFQARRVSAPHRIDEERCEACHDTWGPAQRIGATFTGATVHSVTNEKCEACHPGPLHHANQFPGHDPTSASGEFLSCAECHREHRGDVDLKFVASRHCTDCHGQLDEHLLENVPGHAGPPPYALAIRDFDEGGGHPDFTLVRALAGESIPNRDDAVVTREPPRPTLAPFVTPKGKPASDASWYDPGRIRFNHYAHLRRPLPVQENEENRTRWNARMQCYEVGPESSPPEPVDCTDRTAKMVQLECRDCHAPDADERYMQPIDYTEHCRICHRIPYDTENFPGQTVPHAAIAEAARENRGDAIDVLRGFLTEKYSQAAVADRGNDSGETLDDLLLVPGRPTQTLLTSSERERVRASADAAGDGLLRNLTDEDILVLRSVGNVLGHQARGGCRFCHEVDRDLQPFGDAPADLTVEPPAIPTRWMPHSRFNHASHRNMSCGRCHRNERLLADPARLGVELPRWPGDVEGSTQGGPTQGGATKQDDWSDVLWSTDTADVLMPSIAVCRQCHSQHPTNAELGSARSDCVECHGYHGHSSDPLETGRTPRP